MKDITTITLSIEEIRRLVSRIHEINRYDLSEITWTDHGVAIEIPSGVVDRFLLTGLNNVDFITSGYYRRES